jgi:hypothetical protein
MRSAGSIMVGYQLGSGRPTSSRSSGEPRALPALVLYRGIVLYIVLLTPVLVFAADFASSGGSNPDLTDSTGSAFNQLVTIFVLINSLILAWVFQVPISGIYRALLPLALICVWMLLSTSWSEYPDLTARRAIRSIGLGLPVIYLVWVLSVLMRSVSESDFQIRDFGSVDYALYLFWEAVIYNITESSFFRSGHMTWAMILLVSTLAAKGSHAQRGAARILHASTARSLAHG